MKTIIAILLLISILQTVQTRQLQQELSYLWDRVITLEEESITEDELNYIRNNDWFTNSAK